MKRRTKSFLSTRDSCQSTISQVLPSGEHWHDKPIDALKEIQCPPLLYGIPHWNCLLHKCKYCLSYKVPMNYEDLDENAPTIRFHYYCKVHRNLVLGSTSCDFCNNVGEMATKRKFRRGNT
jgi:hypothetical protein